MGLSSSWISLRRSAGCRKVYHASAPITTLESGVVERGDIPVVEIPLVLPPSPPTRPITTLESGVVERGEIPVVEIPRMLEARTRGQPP